MKGKKWLSLLIVISMVVSFLPLAATATNYSDTQEHWAKAEIAKWSDLGILQGSGNLFRPSAPITRGEMAIILDRIMKYQAKASNSFVDLDQNWYTDAVLKANAAGIIQGDGKTVRPLDKITREEAAVMFGRALGLGESSGATSFADNASISTWARGYINAMADKGLVGGVGGNQFAPKAYITRGEVVKMLDNAVKGFYTTADTQSGTVNGTAIVNADGATLKNMTINGDLIIAEGVGDGEVTLDSVKVAGQTIVRGGGENSVIVTGNSSLGKVIVSKKSDGAVSVKVTGNAKVDVVVAENGSINVSGTVSRLDVKGDVDVALVNAKVATINVQSAAVVAIDKGSVVTTVSVDAPKANIAVSGTVTTVTASANATNAQITTTSTAKITSVVAQAQGTTITGSGSITTVKAEANNVAVSTPNTKVEAATGTTGVTAGGNTVNGGSSATTDNSGTGSTTTPPSGGGGGGGGGGGSTTVRVGSVSVSTPIADGIGSDATNIGKYTVGTITGTTPNYSTVITANAVLVDVPSANAQQGTAKWVGILITTDREVNTLAVKTPSMSGFANLTEADSAEAQAVGASGTKTFVWWLKSEEMTTAKTISIKVQGQGDTTAVALNANFTPYVETPDTNPPTLATGSPVKINGEGWPMDAVANEATIKRGAVQPTSITVTMSEAVSHVVVPDAPLEAKVWVTTTSNGNEYAEYGTFTVSGSTLTVTPRTFQPAPVDGTFTFKILANMLQDATGNVNEEITFTLTFDGTAPELEKGDSIKVNFEDNQGTTQAVAAGGTVSFTPGNVVHTIEVTLTEAVNITGTVSITMTPSGDGAKPIQGYATVDKGASNVLVITPTNINYQTIKYGGTFTYSITNDASNYIADAAGNKLTPTEITLTFKAMPKLITEISVAARHDNNVLADGQPSHINDKKFTVAGDALDNTYTVTVTGTDVLESEKGDAPAEGKWMGIRFTLGGINDITTVKYGATNDSIDALTVDEAIAEADRYNSFMLYVDGNVTTTTRYIKDANGYVYTIVVNYTEYVDTTAPTVSSTVYKQADNKLVITFSKPVLFYLDDEDKSKVTDPAILLSSLYAVPYNGEAGIALKKDTSTTVAFGSDETLETGVTTITITNCKPIFIAEPQNFFLSVSNATVKSVVGIELDQSSVEKLKFEVKDVLTVVNTTENVALMKAALESPALDLDLSDYNQLSDGLKMKVAEYVLGNKSGGYINQDAVEDQFTAAVAAKKEAAEATTGLGDAIMYYDTLENALAADHATLKVDSYTVSKDLQAENNLTIPNGKTLILAHAQTGTGSVIVEAGGAFQIPKVNIVGASNAYFTPTEDGTIVISPIESGTKTKYVLNGTITVNKHTREGGITIMDGDELDLSAATLAESEEPGDAENATFIIKSGGKLTTAAAKAFYFKNDVTALDGEITATTDHTFTYNAETSKWVSDAHQYLDSDVKVVKDVTVTVTEEETPNSLTLTLEGELEDGNLTSNEYLAAGASTFFAAFYNAEGAVAEGNPAGGKYVAVAFEQSKILKAAGIAQDAKYWVVQSNPMLEHFTKDIIQNEQGEYTKTKQYTFSDKFNNVSYLWFLLGDMSTYSEQITFKIKSDSNNSAGETLYTITIVNNVTVTPAD